MFLRGRYYEATEKYPVSGRPWEAEWKVLAQHRHSGHNNGYENDQRSAGEEPAPTSAENMNLRKF